MVISSIITRENLTILQGSMKSNDLLRLKTLKMIFWKKHNGSPQNLAINGDKQIVHENIQMRLATNSPNVK